VSGELQRFGWCWDHSTNWTPGVHGQQTIGTNRSYEKRPDVFLSDFKRLLDFLGSKGFSGLCVWGLLRESHGGVEAAREIVEYGRQRGVSVTPGVGLYTYGGAFFEGRHEFNVETFAFEHPDYVATITQEWPEPLSFTQLSEGTSAPDLADAYLRRKHPWVQLCPSKSEVLAWVKDAVSWVIEALELDTIMLEGGDVFTCRCEACRKRRKRTGDERVSLEDLGNGYVPVVEYLHRHHGDVKIQCETYAAPGLAPASTPAPGLAPASTPASNGGFIPEDCVPFIEAIPEPAQLELTYNFPIPEERLNLPESIAGRGLLRTECGTQWRGPRSHCCVEVIAAQCRACRKLGIPAVSLFVEEPDTAPAHWINYQAFETFSKEDIPVDAFIERDIAPHLGGPERAREFIRWATDPKCADTNEGIAFARKAGSSAADEDEFLKWAWLARFTAEYGAANEKMMAPRLLGPEDEPE